ncbi:glycosyltransferase family 39 protein [Coraliomargarita akajimensis]|uniref:Glycosyltransferase RgtA/B/C/D-like domain-containing protein n=1 Tax=Coraliomargarita akajimensis (strain DSM 45221 / IAM 15411 / JCM 23193 / KCTC 12865 / 04OKA010-24) TaxID=583355 RepID=D5EMR9_CORAD|nr:glycosyltransferase family 39 protein [Coraliomargarita akajimensis]ADE55309.1 conserved hypothetical protein [Coraliomargarita akajimensis DSM 45221]
MRSKQVVQLGLLAASSILAVFLAFLVFDSAEAVALVKRYAYWVMLFTFVAAILLGIRVHFRRDRLHDWRSVLFTHRWALSFILCVSGFLLVLQPGGFKIMMDEPVLAVTALRMHEYKEVMATGRAHEIQGVYTQLDGYVDKRPFFYPFLVSLVHDFTGFRSENSVLLNQLLTPIFIGLLFVIGRRCWPGRGGYLAVLLFASLPLLSMTANGGGMGMLNLVMIALVALAAMDYLKQPGVGRMNLLILLGILLAQTRYESVVYVLPVALVVLLGWGRKGQIELSWLTVAAPLLLIPYGLQRLIFEGHDSAYELREGSTEAFAFGHILPNLQAAEDFFFNLSTFSYPNSALLSSLFVLAAAIFVVQLLRGRSISLRKPPVVVALGFGAVVVFNFLLLMSYHWGQLNDIMATRIVLPFVFLQVLFCCTVLGGLGLSRQAELGLYCVVGLFLIGFTVPSAAKNNYLQWVPGHHEARWVQEQARLLRGTNSFLISNSHIIALAERVPAVPEIHAKSNKAKLELHLDLHTYRDVYLIHRFCHDPKVSEDLVPATPVYHDFELELVKETKLGRGRFMRMSRVTDVIWHEGDKPLKVKQAKLPITDAERTAFVAETLP